MDGWKTERLGKVCTIEIGGTPSRNKQDYWDAEKSTTNCWASIKDLEQRVVTVTLENISDLGVRHSNVKLQAKGTVLLSFKLTIGRVAYAGADLYTNEAIAGLKSTTLNNDFLYYGLQHWDLLKGVDQAIKGATLNKEKLKNIEITYPESKEEQAQIAAVLYTMDQAIEHTEAVIAKQQRIKTGLMQDLLTHGIDEHGNIRSEKTHTFKDSSVGRIPAEWKVLCLADVLKLITSGSRGWARYYSDEGPLFLRIGNLTREHINLRLDDVVKVTPPPSAEGARTAVQKDDLLISITADLGIIGMIPKGFGKAYVNQHIALVRLDQNKIRPKWVAHFLSGPVCEAQFATLNDAGAKAGLNLPTVSRISIVRPLDDEQERIINLLDECDSAVSHERRHLRKLCRLKAGLMQDLLTGKVRLIELLKKNKGKLAGIA